MPGGFIKIKIMKRIFNAYFYKCQSSTLKYRETEKIGLIRIPKGSVLFFEWCIEKVN